MKHNQVIEIMLEKSPKFRETYEKLLAWDENRTIKELANKFNCTTQCAFAFRNKYRLKFKSSRIGRAYSYKDYSGLLKKWDGSLSILENAKKIGITSSKAYLLKSRFNLPFKKITKRGSFFYNSYKSEKSDQCKKIDELRKAGFTFIEIGKLYGITRERVRQLSTVTLPGKGESK